LHTGHMSSVLSGRAEEEEADVFAAAAAAQAACIAFRDILLCEYQGEMSVVDVRPVSPCISLVVQVNFFFFKKKG